MSHTIFLGFISSHIYTHINCHYNLQDPTLFICLYIILREHFSHVLQEVSSCELYFLTFSCVRHYQSQHLNSIVYEQSTFLMKISKIGFFGRRLFLIKLLLKFTFKTLGLYMLWYSQGKNKRGIKLMNHIIVILFSFSILVNK